MVESIILEPNKQIGIIGVGCPDFDRLVMGLKYRNDRNQMSKALVEFTTQVPHPESGESAKLLVLIDSIGYAFPDDGSTYEIFATLVRDGVFWATKGDSQKDPRVRIRCAGTQGGAFDLHLDS